MPFGNHNSNFTIIRQITYRIIHNEYHVHWTDAKFSASNVYLLITRSANASMSIENKNSCASLKFQTTFEQNIDPKYKISFFIIRAHDTKTAAFLLTQNIPFYSGFSYTQNCHIKFIVFPPLSFQFCGNSYFFGYFIVLMIFILDGNSELGAHVMGNHCYMIC